MPLQIDSFSYDEATGIINKQRKEYKLTKLQKKLFDYFLAHPKQIINKETLMQEVWGRIVTDNTINKFISALRLYVEEDSSQPKVIVTHFGHGISFEGNIVQQEFVSKKKLSQWTFLSVVLLLSIISLVYFLNQKSKVATAAEKRQIDHVLILPTDYENLNVEDTQKQGLAELMQSVLKGIDSEGQVLFGKQAQSNREAIEKYWRLDKKLVVLQSRVQKNGEIYQATINLTQGNETLDTAIIKGNSLADLMQGQIDFISHYQGDSQKNKITTIDDDFIKAMAYIKKKNFIKAKTLLEKVLVNNASNYQAQFQLAVVYAQLKDYNQSLAQLNTLKVTDFYTVHSSEIELAIADILFKQHNYEQIIDDLKKYQSTHLKIGEVKKAKIKLQIAEAYFALGEIQNAMKFYKQAIMHVNAEFNPKIFAQSFYGQGRVLENQSNADDTFSYFEKALAYAQEANDYTIQILSLDEMAKILLVGNEWEKGLALKKQAIEIMEMEDDKGRVSQGLGTLAAFLIQTGHFSQAKEINDRLGRIAKELKSDGLLLSYLHYDSIVLMNFFKFENARSQIDKHLKIAQSSKNLTMQLDNAFLEFELRLAQKDLSNFKVEWEKRTQLIKEMGFERYQVYMDFYLARYYKQTNEEDKAIAIINKISEQAKANNDLKMLVDAQNQLAEIYMKSDAQKSLDVLNAIEKYQPDANPYLELKALALNKLGRKLEALNLLNQAKLVFHEAWKSENEILLEQLKENFEK
jgi:DNA-binding winged helix-turn-helix (wHTH) protein/Tfp pilus assembly protein PilF